MVMKGYSAFPKALELLQRHYQMVSCPYPEYSFEGSYPSAEMQSVYSVTRVDWAKSLWLYTTISLFPSSNHQQLKHNTIF